MQSDPESAPKSQAKFQSNYLLTCSIVNILIFPLCVGLEVGRPFAGQGVWGSITFIVAGLLGFSTSYKPTRPMIISTTVFSSLSICFALVSGVITMAGSRGFKECTYYQNYPEICYFRVNPLVLTIANLVSFVNNIIVTVLLSRLVCKCCTSADSSIPVMVVHNPPQPTPMWVIPPAGQQPQFQSYPTVVYSPYQQQAGHQQGQQQWQADQHPSAPSNLPTSSTDLVSLANPSPPPYSTAAASEPLMKKGSYKS